MTGGFVAISRAIWDDPDFRDSEMSQREAFIWIVAHASWKPHTVRVGTAVIDLERGQLAYSTRYLAKVFGWSEARVRRYFDVLKNRRTLQTKTDAGVTVITVCNYDAYQSAPDKTDAGATQPATQERRTSDASKNKDNKIKKTPSGQKNKSSLPAGFPDQPAKDAAVAYWQGKGRGYLSQRLETIADTFRAHHESRGTKAMSWPATWKTWYVNQVSFEEKSGKPAEVPRSSADPPAEHIDERSIEGQRKLVDRYKRTGKWDARTFAAPDDPNTRLRPEVLAEFGYSQQLI